MLEHYPKKNKLVECRTYFFHRVYDEKQVPQLKEFSNTTEVGAHFLWGWQECDHTIIIANFIRNFVYKVLMWENSCHSIMLLLLLLFILGLIVCSHILLYGSPFYLPYFIYIKSFPYYVHMFRRTRVLISGIYVGPYMLWNSSYWIVIEVSIKGYKREKEATYQY